MKKNLLALVLAALLLLAGCAGCSQEKDEGAVPPAGSAGQGDLVPSGEEDAPPAPAGDETAPPVEETPVSPALPIWVDRSAERQAHAEDGVLLVEATATIPYISNPEAADSFPLINADLDRELEDLLSAAVEGMRDSAQEDYEWAPQAGMDFTPRAWDLDYSISWGNENYVSLMGAGYLYLGGVHGDTWISSLLYDLKSGARLDFDDLFADPQAAADAVLAQIQAQVQSGMDADPDAFLVEASAVEANFDPQRFYLTGDGFVFYFGTYELGPYAMGIPTYTILWDAMPEMTVSWN